jgi:hypothetical protein
VRRSLEARRAVLLIDPFVNQGKPGPEAACGLLGSILPLFNALVQNSRFKPEDLAMAADPEIGSRFLLAPSRGPDWEAEGAIAAGHLGGFMGFFAQAYREHDFFLGRRNAQRFLDQNFVLPEANPLFGPREGADRRWSDPDRELWGRKRTGVTGRHLPIIPLCGELAWREERLPNWPEGRFDAAELEPLVKERAKVAVPALAGALLDTALKKDGLWSGVKHRGARALSFALRPLVVGAVVERVMNKVAAEARALDAAPRGRGAQAQASAAKANRPAASQGPPR